MKAITKQSTLHAKLKTNKLWHGALVLFASSALFACSQPETSSANVSAVKAEQQTVTANVTENHVAETHTEAMNTPISNPDLLKNISATVYKDANCGCCKDWISHAEDNGIEITAHDVADVGVFKERYGVAKEMASCHTAVTSDGYVFEGHVPAKYMAQFLANPPAQAIGLAVPGMPMGSPGMEYQNQFDAYQVMQINKDGSTEVFADISSPAQQL